VLTTIPITGGCDGKNLHAHGNTNNSQNNYVPMETLFKMLSSDIEGSKKEIKDDIAAVTTKVDTLMTNVANLTTNVAVLSTNVNALTNTIKVLGGDLKALDTFVKESIATKDDIKDLADASKRLSFVLKSRIIVLMVAAVAGWFTLLVGVFPLMPK
jgi:outer membrane murein-binding lipoprotein Lpp